MYRFAGLVAVLGCLATPLVASDLKFAVFSISAKKTEVKVRNAVGGFFEKQVLGYVSEHCQGAVGDLVAKGKPKKKRGNVFQEYRTTCTGGVKQSVLATSRVTVEVEAMPNGKTLFEYTYSQDGNIKFTKRSQ